MPIILKVVFAVHDETMPRCLGQKIVLPRPQHAKIGQDRTSIYP